LNRERFDYARVLISMSSLDVGNISDKSLVDGTMVEIRIIEEWGFNLGDDACLYDEDDKSISDSQVNTDIHEDFEINKNVENLADKIVHDLVEAENLKNNDTVEYGKANVEITDTIEVQEHVLHSVEHLASPACANLSTDTPEIFVDSSIKDGSVKATGNGAPCVSEMNEAKLAAGGNKPTLAVSFLYDDVGK
jgi:hypothetical protein